MDPDAVHMAFYDAHYPGKVMHLDDPLLIGAVPLPRRDYYVVTAGCQVGIFTDWLVLINYQSCPFSESYPRAGLTPGAM